MFYLHLAWQKVLLPISTVIGKKIVIRRYSNQIDFLIAEQHFACFLCYCDCFYAWW